MVVNATTYSDKVEVDQTQSGNRVDVQSHLLPGATAENPGGVRSHGSADASVTLESMTGPCALRSCMATWKRRCQRYGRIRESPAATCVKTMNGR